MIEIKFGKAIGANKVLIASYADSDIKLNKNAVKLRILDGQLDAHITSEGYDRLFDFIEKEDGYVISLPENVSTIDNEYVNFIAKAVNSFKEYVIYSENRKLVNDFSFQIAKFFNIYEKVLVVDTHNFFHRTFHAMAGQANTSHNGVQTGLLKPLANLLRWSLKQEYSHIVFATESKVSKRYEFTKAKYADESMHYKSKSLEKDPLLIEQIETCNKFLKDVGLEVCQVEGYEADDIIASISKRFNNVNVPIHIFTSDKDMYQLYEYPNVSIMDTKTRKLIDKQFYIEKFTVLDPKTGIAKGATITPELFVDYQSIIGDASDSVIGIKGAGPAAACVLLHKYGSLKGICEAVIAGENVGVKAVNSESIKDAIISRDLVYLRRDLLNSIDLTRFSKKYYNFEDMLVSEFLKYDIKYLN